MHRFNLWDLLYSIKWSELHHLCDSAWWSLVSWPIGLFLNLQLRTPRLRGTRGARWPPGEPPPAGPTATAPSPSRQPEPRAEETAFLCFVAHPAPSQSVHPPDRPTDTGSGAREPWKHLHRRNGGRPGNHALFRYKIGKKNLVGLKHAPRETTTPVQSFLGTLIYEMKFNQGLTLHKRKQSCGHGRSPSACLA